MKWRDLANRVVADHDAHGISFTTFTGDPIPDNLSVEDVSPSHLFISGSTVPSEAIRSALWEWRKYLVPSSASLVWSKWFKDRNVSVIGLGKLVPQETPS